MALITDYLYIDVSIGLTTLLAILYTYLKSKNSYWKNRGIPYVKPTLLFGNLADTIFGRKSLVEVHDEIYKRLDGEKFGGYFELVSPNLLIRDPELIEKILIKDFVHFMDRGFGDPDPENEPLSMGLSALNGLQWRSMRYKLTPTFTSGKLKGMFEQICNCGEELVKELKKYSDSCEAVEAKTVLSLFTTDVIASCAFGLQFKHDSEEGKQFREMANKVFAPSKIQILRFLFFVSFEKLAKLFGVRRFPPNLNDYFLNIVRATISYREKNKVKRNDFLQLLMVLKEQEKSDKSVGDFNQELNEEDAYLKQENYKPTENDPNNLGFSDDVLAAQAFLFLVAGAETTSGTTAFALFSLATHPEIQQRAKEEVDSVAAKSGWNYQSVKDMTYLDQIIQESLRIHPFGAVLNRIVTTPYKLPGTDIVLPRGERVTIPVYPIHMDPTHYENPEQFDPERFKDNNHKPSFKYMPFGDGPRMCIAMRFAVLEMKICLARILSKYYVTLSDKTELPLKYDPSSFMPRPKGGIWLHFALRQQ